MVCFALLKIPCGIRTASSFAATSEILRLNGIAHEAQTNPLLSRPVPQTF